MRSPIRTPRAPARVAWGLILAGLLLVALPALAQDPIVTAADPNMAEQETYDLVVKITGNYFGTDSVVDFYVSGTTNPGGIHVKNVKRKNARTLEATIDVAPDAEVDFFDIQVYSNGRTGKGTELFKVLVKPTGGGNDTTPPGEVTDLYLLVDPVLQPEGLPVLQPEGDYAATLTWTAPADDGYVASSGPADFSQVAARPVGSPFTLESWNDHVPWSWVEAGPPNELQTAQIRMLAPDTEYHLKLRSRDDSGWWSGLSTNELRFWTGPPGPSNWVRDAMIQCPVAGVASSPHLEFDLDGSPVLFNRTPVDFEPPASAPMRLTRRSSSGWETVALPQGIADAENGSDFAIDPISGVPTVVTVEPPTPAMKNPPLVLLRLLDGAWEREVVDADPGSAGGAATRSLAFDAGASFSRPAIAMRASPRGSRTWIRLLVRNVQGWEKHDLSATVCGSEVELAFDDGGRVGVAYGDCPNGSVFPNTLKFALWDGSSWRAETVESPATSPDGRACGRGISLAWNPAALDFEISHYCDRRFVGDSVYPLRHCGRDPATGAWTCSTVGTHDSWTPTALVVDQAGTAYLAAMGSLPTNSGGFPSLELWTRTPGTPPSWSREVVDWSVSLGRVGLRIDSTTGLPALAYFAELHPAPEVILARRLP